MEGKCRKEKIIDSCSEVSSAKFLPIPHKLGVIFVI